jgi:signal peptidase I
LATAVLDVHPPRAGRFEKRMRRLRPPVRAYRGARGAASAAGRGAAVALESLTPRFPPLPVTLRLVWPGWSHFYLGQRSRGHLFLWSFLSCLLPGLLMLGTVWGSIQLGLAFSVHSSAVLDICSRGFGPGELRDRLLRGLGVSALVGVLLYWPAGMLLTRVADPCLIQIDVAPALADGDVLLVNHLLAPRPGRVVLYELPAYTPPTLGHMRVYYGGDRVDRILAGPGDTVRYADGRLWVNGRPSLWFPLNGLRITGRSEFTVPTGHYFIIPSTTIGPVGRVPEGLWSALGIVPASSIRGCVYWRSHPLSRFGRVG